MAFLLQKFGCIAEINSLSTSSCDWCSRRDTRPEPVSKGRGPSFPTSSVPRATSPQSLVEDSETWL